MERSSSKREFLANVSHKVTGGLGGDDSRNESIMLKGQPQLLSQNHFSSNEKNKSSDPWQCTLSETTYCNYYRARPSGWSASTLYTHHKETYKQVFFFCLTMITGPGLGLFLYFHIIPVFFRALGHICTKVSLPACSKNKMADLRYKYNSYVLRMLTTIKDSGSM